jgi:hypothetical protein
MGYGCAYLDAVLRSALAGGTQRIAESDLGLRSAAMSLVRWSLCFLAGPAILIYFAIRHVLQCTIVTPLDALIVANLVVTAVSYWMIELIASNGRTQLAPPAPQQVLNVARQLKWRAYLAGLAAVAAGIVYAALGASAIWLLAGPWAICLALSWLWWFSAWECSAFVLRTVGFWHYRGGTDQPGHHHRPRQLSEVAPSTPPSVRGEADCRSSPARERRRERHLAAAAAPPEAPSSC